MTITNYTELLAAGANWLDDSNLTARWPEFITLCENGLNYGLKMPGGIDIDPLRSKRMETRGSLTIDQEYVAQPTDFLEAISMRLTSTNPIKALEFFQEADFNNWDFASSATGEPKAYTVTGTNFRFGPYPSSLLSPASYTAEVVYMGLIPALTSVATTNWVITYHPNVYLTGILLQAALFQENDEGIARYAPAHMAACKGVNYATMRGRFSGPLRARSLYTRG